MDGYWCDIGDIRAYLAAHIAAMNGEIRLPGIAPRPGGIAILPGAAVDRTAVLEAPCLIAPGAQVRAGAHIGAQPDGTDGWGVATVGPDTAVPAGGTVPAGAMIYDGAEVHV